MADEEIRTASEESEEMADAVTDLPVSTSRYNLRTRVAPKERDTVASMPNLTKETITDGCRALANAAAQSVVFATSHLVQIVSSTSMTSGPVTRIDSRHDDVEGIDGGLRPSAAPGTSPFEMFPTRGWSSRRLPTVPAYSNIARLFARSEPGLRRNRDVPRVRLHSSSRGQDIPYVPPSTQTVSARSAASEFATRMTAMEQTRVPRCDDTRREPGVKDRPSWLEFHRMFDQRIGEGERALDFLAQQAVDFSDKALMRDMHHTRADLDPSRETSELSVRSWIVAARSR